MKEAAQLLNAMRSAGVISEYALFGATAQMRYTEPVATFDVDVLVVLPLPKRSDPLKSVFKFCRGKGYRFEGESVRVGTWPVQFLPAFMPLTLDAVKSAETVDFDGEPLRVVRADYLAVMALGVGRAKDFARILALLESGSVTPIGIDPLAKKYRLWAEWKKFQGRFLDA